MWWVVGSRLLVVVVVQCAARTGELELAPAAHMLRHCATPPPQDPTPSYRLIFPQPPHRSNKMRLSLVFQLNSRVGHFEPRCGKLRPLLW